MEFQKGEVVEWVIEDKERMTLKVQINLLAQTKKNNGSLTDELDALFNQYHPAFSDHESWVKRGELMYGELTCLGWPAFTGMLATSGNQFVDWSAAWRVFSKQHVDVSKIMNVVQTNVLQETSCIPCIVAHMDDTVIKKTGKRISGTKWRRDPLGPHFQTNFIWGQRFPQMSLALPPEVQTGQQRAIPVYFHHCPTIDKLRKTAEKEQWQVYK